MRVGSKTLAIYLLYAAFFAAALLAARGYQFGYNESTLTVPLIEAVNDPILALDFSVETNRYYHRNFNLAGALFGSFVPLPVYFFTGFLITLGAIGAALRFFLKPIVQRESGILLTIACLVLWDNQSLDRNSFWHNRTFEAQLVAWPVIFTVCGFLLRGRLPAAALLTGLVMAIHIQMGLILSAVTACFVLFSRGLSPARLVRCAALYAVFAVPTLIQLAPAIQDHAHGEEFFAYVTARIIHHVAIQPWIYLFFLLIGAVAADQARIARWRRTPDAEVLAKTAAIAWIVLALISIHYADFYWIRNGAITRLHLSRLNALVYLIGVALLCRAVSMRVEDAFRRAGKRRTTAWICLAALLAAAAAGTSLHPATRPLAHRISPVVTFDARKASHPYKILGRWIRHNTPREALFITPPYRHGFVLFAGRRTVADFKFAPQTASTIREWIRRINDLTLGYGLKDCGGFDCLVPMRYGYLSLSKEDVMRLAQKYGVDYFVTESSKSYDFKEVYRDRNFKIYRLF